MEQNTPLSQKKCAPCKGNTPPLPKKEITGLHAELGGEWEIVDSHHLEKTYSFANFKDALAFTNEVGKIAEEEGHHPDIYLAWGKVKITLWTHKINGLTESDFILASKCDQIGN